MENTRDWLSRLLEMIPVRGALDYRCVLGAPWRIDFPASGIAERALSAPLHANLHRSPADEFTGGSTTALRHVSEPLSHGSPPRRGSRTSRAHPRSPSGRGTVTLTSQSRGSQRARSRSHSRARLAARTSASAHPSSSVAGEAARVCAGAVGPPVIGPPVIGPLVATSVPTKLTSTSRVGRPSRMLWIASSRSPANLPRRLCAAAQ